MTCSRIRTIPVEEDPRRLFAIPPQPPLKNSIEHFPLLNDAPYTPARADPALGALSDTYSDMVAGKATYPLILEHLPRELRDQIWEAYVRLVNRERYPEGPIEVRWATYFGGGSVAYPAYLPRICLTTLWIKGEVIEAFLRSSEFKIWSSACHKQFRAFLATIPNGMNHVRELFFEASYYLSLSHLDLSTLADKNLGLAIECPNIQILRLNFRVGELSTDT
jgi:hypothetical protein